VSDSADLQNALGRLVVSDPGYQPLDPELPVGPRPGSRSLGVPGGNPEQSGGGGDFSEPDATTREYWPDQVITSSDGIFAFRISPIKTIFLESGQAASFADPAATPP
jgi:hypothetical protein